MSAFTVAAAGPATPPPIPSVADEIKKVAAPRDHGILTETEFDDEKKQFLGL